MVVPMSGLTIGKLASQAGVGVETVRFYERKGLLAQPPRPLRGFRHYPVGALRRLNFIRGARELGFNLVEIGELLSLRENPSATCEDVRSRSEQKLVEIDRRITLLQDIRSSLHSLLETCESDGPVAECPILDWLEDS